jgi:uncharacterized protein (TIGR02145 family)
MKKLFLALTIVLFVIPFGISQDLPSYVPTGGLAAFYTFDGNANDSSSNSNHGVVNGPNLSDDRNSKQNSSYFFDGTDDYIDMGLDNSLKIQNQFSASVWFKHMGGLYDNCNPRIFETKDNSIGNGGYALGLSKGTQLHLAYFGTENSENGFFYIDNFVDLNNWTHVAFSVDGINLEAKIYVNGQLYASKPINSFENISYEGELIIGNIDPSRCDWFRGNIDELGLWNRILTEQEIQNLYTSSIGDIKLNGVVSAENNQIRNVADPTHGKDAVTKDYLLEKIALLQNQIDVLQSTSGSGTVTDQDGNSYPYLTYGDQVWTVKNAEMVTYRDGTPIPQVTDATEWANLTTGAWCYYDNDSSKGKLYNWYAVAGIHDNDENTPNKELAPEGWHVPTDAEWTELENYLIANGYNYDGTTTENKIAKAMASKTGWTTFTGEGAIGNDLSLNNSSGFSAVPGGSILGDVFSGYGSEARLWTSTYYGSDRLYHKRMDFRFSHIYTHNEGATLASSIRFVRD